MTTTTRTAAPSAPPDADSHEVIRVHGARENNLRDVNLDLPKRQLTVFTGVSGSGKSSLVFATIAAESQRMINETYSSFVQGFMPTLARPDVDVPGWPDDGDHRRPGADGRQRPLHRRHRHRRQRAAPHPVQPAGQAAHRSARRRSRSTSLRSSGGGAITVGWNRQDRKKPFTLTGRHVPALRGHGHDQRLRPRPLYDETKSLNDGAITIPGYTPTAGTVRIFAESGFLDPDKPIKRLRRQRELHDFLYHEPTKIKIEGINITYEGLVPKIQKSLLAKDVDAMQPHIRAFVERAVTFSACPECGGTRLSEAARSSKIRGISIADACAMQISDLADWVRGLDEPSVAPLLANLQHTPRRVRGDRAWLPQPRPPVGHAVGRRGSADEDDPPPPVGADRHDLRVR